MRSSAVAAARGATGPRSSRRASRRRHLPLFYKLSFANKILVSTLALLTVLGIAGTVVFQLMLRSRMHDELAASTQLLAATAADRAGPLLVAGDTVGLEGLVHDLARVDDSIEYVLVRDREGTVLAHTFSWDPPKAVRAAAPTPSALGSGRTHRVQLGGRTYLDVAAPIVSRAAGAGTLQIGMSIERIDRFVGELNLVFLAVLAGLTLLGMVVARSFYRYVTRPVVELTHLADEVSAGNLDVDLAFGLPVKCWEIKGCGRTECTAYENTEVQCWFVDGTPCEGYEPRFPQKLVGCRTCEVYRAHKGDEIVQLYDSFRHMTLELQRSTDEIGRAARFRGSLIRNSFDGIIATDESGTVRIFNRVAQNLTGYTERDVLGVMTWDEIFASEPRRDSRRPLFQDGRKVIFGFYRQERSIRCKDGSAVAVRASGITLREGQRPVGRVLFFQDLREVNRLKEELIQSERLAATGQTVASISHAVKNILEGLRGGAYIYKRGVRIEDPAIRKEGWGMVERNIDVISALVADLLNFARDRRPDLEPLDPHELVRDVLQTLQPKADAQGTTLELVPTPPIASWLLDSHGMHQCLMNLVTNALDATAAVDGGWVRLSVLRTDTGEIEFRVQDNGPGVAPNLAESLFSSMVTTKGSKGTGLGLLVVHKIVTEHRGKVLLDTRMAPGATFRVLLPSGTPRSAAVPEASGAGERPLLEQA